MKFALEIYLWTGLLFGLLTLIFGLMRERSAEQHTLMNGLKWLLGAGAVTLAWPVAMYWILEGELYKRKARKTFGRLNPKDGGLGIDKCDQREYACQNESAENPRNEQVNP